MILVDLLCGLPANIFRALLSYPLVFHFTDRLSLARSRPRSVARAPAGGAHATQGRASLPRECRKEPTVIGGRGASRVIAKPRPAETPTPPHLPRKKPSVPAKRKSPPPKGTATRPGHISTSPDPPPAKRKRVPSPAPRAAQGTTGAKKQGGLAASSGATPGPGRPPIPNPTAFPERQRLSSPSPRGTQRATGTKKKWADFQRPRQRLFLGDPPYRLPGHLPSTPIQRPTATVRTPGATSSPGVPTPPAHAPPAVRTCRTVTPKFFSPSRSRPVFFHSFAPVSPQRFGLRSDLP